MAAAVDRGYLVLADISGYTGYLAASELDHANEILADLIDHVVSMIVPPLELADIEGDAVFAYGSVDRDESVLDAIEDAYAAFRRRRELMEARTTCPCNACRQIGTLELKFVVHWGEYLRRDVAGRATLLGSEVNLAHRLLKNGVAEATGWEAYVLLTRPARDLLALPLEGLHERQEEYEHLGRVVTLSYDLHPRWRRRVAGEKPDVDEDNADWQLSAEIAAAPRVVWQVLNDPVARADWGGADRVEQVRAPDGRTGPGATIHCHHGDKVISHTVVQWHPFAFMTERLPVRHGFTVAISYLLRPEDGGTRFTFATRLVGRAPRSLGRLLCKRGGEEHLVPALYRIRDLAETLAERTDRAGSTALR